MTMLITMLTITRLVMTPKARLCWDIEAWFKRKGLLDCGAATAGVAPHLAWNIITCSDTYSGWQLV